MKLSTNICKFYWSLIILLPSCIGGVSTADTITDDYYEQRRRSLDIIDLIDLFVDKAGTQDRAGDFKQGSQVKQIVWEQKGILGADNQFGDFMARTGEIYIRMDSAFTTFVLRTRREPAPWKITISGGHVGYLNVLLRDRIFTEEFTGFEDYFQKKKILLSKQVIPSTALGPGYSSVKMQLHIRDRDITVLECLSCGGNSGCSVDLYFKADGQDFKTTFEDVEGFGPKLKKGR